MTTTTPARLPLTELLTQCGLSPKAPHDAKKLAVFGTQVQGHRGFPQGFWHPEDLDDAIDTMRACLDDLEMDSAFVLAAQTDLANETASWLDEHDEDDARRLQITAVIAMANARLAASNAPHRFVEFEEPVAGWESDEPVWALVTGDELQLLTSLGWTEVADS